MKIDYHKRFKKQFSKLSQKNQKNFEEKLNIFISDTNDIRLSNHCLNGVFDNCRSINITGDLRAIYTINKNSVYIFLRIGKHSNLYK